MTTKNIIEVTGAFGVGKTTFALNAPLSSPSKAAVFNCDTKPTDVDSLLGFHREYAQMVSVGDEEHKYAQMARAWFADVNAFVKGKDTYELVIIDNYSLVSKSIYPLLIRDPSIAGRHWYGIHSKYMMSMETWTAAHVLEQGILSALLQKTNTLVLINHLKNEYVDSEPTGHLIVNSSKALKQVANIRLWLTREAGCASPSALVLKQPASHVYSKDKQRFVTAQTLPQRITAKPDIGYSLWDDMLDYLKNPAGLRELRQDEKFTPDDLQLVCSEMGLGLIPEVAGLTPYLIENIALPFAILRTKVEKQFGTKITEEMVESLK